MGTWGKGMAFLQEQNAQFGSSFGDKLRKMWLKDGDTARFWFLYSPDEMPVPLVHMERRWSKKNNKAFSVDVLCAKDRLDDDDSKCPRCTAQLTDLSDPPKSKGPYPRGVFVVWTDVIGHRTKPAEGTNWKPITAKSTGKPVYMEAVQGLMLFIPGRKLVEQLEAVLAGDLLNAENHGVDIMGHPFRLTVSGEKENKVEIITADPQQDAPEAVRELRVALPDIDQILKNEYGPLPTKGMVVASGNGRPAAANGASGAAAEAVEVPGDDEGGAAADSSDDYEF